MLIIVDRPGYFGRKRVDRHEFYDNMFGERNWSEGWEIQKTVYDFNKAVAFHDEAYYQFLFAHPEIVEFITYHGDCYDCDPSNICSGTEHDEKCTPRHIEDVSVRRALKKLGTWFKGSPTNLLEIHNEQSKGYMLDPAQVPFHMPELILTGHESGPRPKWAQLNSVAHFWQSNKVIAIDMLAGRNAVNL